MLPDPRLNRQYPSHPLLSPLCLEVGGLSAESLQRLRRLLGNLLAQGDDATLQDLLNWPALPAIKQSLRQCLQNLTDGPTDASVRLQLFVIPILIVVGSQTPAQLPVTLSAPDRIVEILRAAGCLGPSRHFALGNALCNGSALAGLAPSALYRMARLEGKSPRVLDLPPSPIALTSAGQSVHLRFLPGSELLALGAPGLRETAGEVGRWGAVFTRELAAQLASPGITVLPLARAPMGLYAALAAGRYCREELAFQLELGEHLRGLRSRTGDPVGRVMVTIDHRVVVELTSPWEPAPALIGWTLHPEDDLAEILKSIIGLLRECRVTELHMDAGLGGEPAAKY